MALVSSGESVSLTLWVRGRGGGRQTIRMLLRYKRAPQESKAGTGEEEQEAVKPNDVLFRCEFSFGVIFDCFVLFDFLFVFVDLCFCLWKHII